MKLLNQCKTVIFQHRCLFEIAHVLLPLPSLCRLQKFEVSFFIANDVQVGFGYNDRRPPTGDEVYVCSGCGAWVIGRRRSLSLGDYSRRTGSNSSRCITNYLLDSAAEPLNRDGIPAFAAMWSAPFKDFGRKARRLSTLSIMVKY